MAGSKQSPLSHWREERKRKKALRGDSPERLEEHHEPKRDWGDMAAMASPGGQRHSTMKGDKR